MLSNLKLDPTFSIIYHDENSVEFRNGVWNVTSHCLNDDEKKGTLAKIILEIDETGLDDIESMCKKLEVDKSDLDEVIEALQQKKLLVNVSKSQAIESDFALNKKIIFLDDDGASRTLINFIQEKIPLLRVDIISRKEFSFIEEHGEAIFRDNLLLEKLIEQSQNLFSDTLVVMFSKSIDLAFYLFVNKVFYEAKIKWFFIAIDGPFIYNGPLFDNHFCFECLDQRILMNAKQTNDYLRYKKALIVKRIKQAKPQADSDVIHFASSLASMEISHYLTTGRCIAKQKILSVFIPTMEFSYHKILRLPGCKVCGVDNALSGHQVHFDMGALAL